MIYMKRFVTENEWFEVSHEKALDTLLTTYKDNEITRDMLTKGGEIPCMFSVIKVVGDE